MDQKQPLKEQTEFSVAQIRITYRTLLLALGYLKAEEVLERK
jgi:hypothetical protein